MPRKTAMPFSVRPRTCPATVRTTGSVTSMRTPSPIAIGKSWAVISASGYYGSGISGCGRLWPPGRRLRLRGEHDDGNHAGRGSLLILCELGIPLLLRLPDRVPLISVGHPGPGLHGRPADLDRDLRVSDQVAEPLRVTGLTAERGEDGKIAVHLLV